MSTSKEKSHKILTTNVGEDREPVFLPDHKSMVFLSERDGKSQNVYMSAVSPENETEVSQLTFFPDYPVRFLSVACDGTLCFGYQGEIYLKRPDTEPEKVSITIVNDQANNVERGKLRDQTI